MRNLEPFRRRPGAQARWCGVLSDSTGSAVVESALVLPLLFAFGFGMVEVGRALWTQNSLQFAVEDAARCAAINTVVCGTTTAIKTYAAGRVNVAAITASDFTVSAPACGKKVSVSYPFESLVPDLVPVSVTLTAQSCHPA